MAKPIIMVRVYIRSFYELEVVPMVPLPLHNHDPSSDLRLRHGDSYFYLILFSDADSDATPIQ